MSKFPTAFFFSFEFFFFSLHFTDTIAVITLVFVQNLDKCCYSFVLVDTPDPMLVSITVFVISTYPYGASSTLYVGL